MILENEQESNTFFLTEGWQWLIGRDKRNDVVLNKNWVSRHHAMIQRSNRQDFSDFYCLLDIGSRNGTFINERRVTLPQNLSHGDRLKFGGSKAVFYDLSYRGIHESKSYRSQHEGISTVGLRSRYAVIVLVLKISNYVELIEKIEEDIATIFFTSWMLKANLFLRTDDSIINQFIEERIVSIWRYSCSAIKIVRTICEVYNMTKDLEEELSLPCSPKIKAILKTGYVTVENLSSDKGQGCLIMGNTISNALRMENSVSGFDIVIDSNMHSNFFKSTVYESLFSRKVKIDSKANEPLISAYVCEFLTLDKFLRGTESS